MPENTNPVDEVVDQLFVEMIETSEFEALTPDQRDELMLKTAQRCTQYVLDRNEV